MSAGGLKHHTSDFLVARNYFDNSAAFLKSLFWKQVQANVYIVFKEYF